MKIKCPACKAEYEMAENQVDKKFICSNCNTKFIIRGQEFPIQATDMKTSVEIVNDLRKHCPFCDELISVNAKKCKHCGEFLDTGIHKNETPVIINNNINNIVNRSTKSRGTYIILAIFLGLLGIHNFYAGYTVTGLIQLVLTCTGIAVPFVIIWIIADILFTTKDGAGQPFS